MSDGPRKAPSDKNNPNHDMCQFLSELSTYERTVSRNIYKANAYRTAAASLAAHPTRVTSGKDAMKIKGIGDKIGKKIDEFLATGKLKKLEKIRVDEVSIALTELTRVSGVGPAKARQLYDSGVTDLVKLRQNKDLLTHHQQIGLRYVDEFEKRIPRSEVEKIESVMRESLAALGSHYVMTVCGSYRRGSEKSGDVDVLLTYDNDQTLQTVNGETSKKISSDINKRRKHSSDSSPDEEETIRNKKVKRDPSFSDVYTTKKLVHGSLKSIKDEPTVSNDSVIINKANDADIKSETGSSDSKVKGPSIGSSAKGIKSVHRRMLQQVVERLQQDGLVTETLSMGDTKFMGVCHVGDCHRRLDIRLLSPDHYSCGVLYFTGSDLFNKEMRGAALTAGFTLNEYNIRPMGSTGVPGEPLPVSSERDVFDYIGLPYRAPADRTVL